MARKSKPMNARRRLRALETSQGSKPRDLNALALIVSRKGGHHGDKRKERNRRACRGKVLD